MTMEWKEVLLGELVEIKHGFAFKGEYFSEEKTNDILLTPGNFAIGGGFQWGKLKFYDGPIPSDYILTEGDLVVTMTDLSKAGDTLGYSAIVPSSQKLLLHNQRIGKIKTKTSSVDEMYLSYQLRTKSYRNEVLASATGSTVKHTSPTKICAYRFLLPPLDEQKAIASVLSALDDKIENNRRMNETLEEMARTIFKSWFVDFDPVHAKVAGNAPAHMDAETAALFPNSFGEDGLPVGWCEEELKKICKFSGGSAFKHEKQGLLIGDYPFIKVSDMNLQNNTRYILDANNWITEETRAEIKAKIQPSNSIVMAKIGVALTYNRLRFLIRDTIVDNNMLAVIPNEKVISSTALFLILSKYDFNFYAKGTALPYLNVSDLAAIPFIMPNEEVLSKFDFYTKPLLEKVLLNATENQTLANLRDTLLPKLMSGEIRVKDAEREVEDAI